MGSGQIRQAECPDSGVVGAEVVHRVAQQRHRPPGSVRVAPGQGQRVVGTALVGREAGLIEEIGPRLVGRPVDGVELLDGLAQCPVASP